MKKPDGRSLSAELQAELRVRAVEAVKKGHSPKAVSEIFGVSRRAVEKWAQLEREQGAKALALKKEGRPEGSGRKLDKVQEKQVRKAIEQHPPEYFDLPFALWTRGVVQQLIKKRFGVCLEASTVGDYLGRWGMTPQKPARKAFQQDSRKVQQWLEEEYPAIEARARKEGARIYWGDETGCRSDHASGTTYSPRGKTPVVAVNGCRFSCNVISAINNSGNLAFLVFAGSFVTDVFLDFLKRLVRQVKRKAFLIVDGHPVHKAKVVKDWLTENEDRIELFYLPGYSPDLNPSEYLNNDLKSGLGKLSKPKNKSQLVNQVRSHLFRRQKQPHIVQALFQHPSVRYAA